jgi:hypothetical protein
VRAPPLYTTMSLCADLISLWSVSLCQAPHDAAASLWPERFALSGSVPRCVNPSLCHHPINLRDIELKRGLLCVLLSTLRKLCACQRALLLLSCNRRGE